MIIAAIMTHRDQLQMAGEKIQNRKRVWKFRGGSRVATTSNMECFVIIVNGFQPLTIITKCSILDVAAALDPPLKQKVGITWELLYQRILDVNK